MSEDELTDVVDQLRSERNILAQALIERDAEPQREWLWRGNKVSLVHRLVGLWFIALAIISSLTVAVAVGPASGGLLAAVFGTGMAVTAGQWLSVREPKPPAPVESITEAAPIAWGLKVISDEGHKLQLFKEKCTRCDQDAKPERCYHCDQLGMSYRIKARASEGSAA